jgi:hypothetical protein
MHDGLPLTYSGVVQEIAGREVVCAVDDHVVAAHQIEHVVGIHACLVSDDLDIRVEGFDRLARRFDLRLADAFRVVDHLALKIGEVDDVVVDDAEGPDTRGCEVEG